MIDFDNKYLNFDNWFSLIKKGGRDLPATFKNFREYLVDLNSDMTLFSWFKHRYDFI